jgi:hypothetical protein
MLAAVPIAREAMDALLNLRSQVEQSLAVRKTDPPSHDDALELASDLHKVSDAVHAASDLADWCRDASIQLARSTKPQATWDELARATGLSDSTISSRLLSWRAREREAGR